MSLDALDITRLLIASIQLLIGGVAIYAYVRLCRLYRSGLNGLVRIASKAALAMALYFLWSVCANIASTTYIYDIFWVHLFIFAFTRLFTSLFVLYVVVISTIAVINYEQPVQPGTGGDTRRD